MASSVPDITDRTPSSKGFVPQNWFWESRKKDPTLHTAVLFTVLRLADLPLQYYFLRSGLGSSLIAKLGGTPVTPPVSSTSILGLQPYHALIMVLATGSSLKQIYWRLAICDTSMPNSFSTLVAVYNTVLNLLNTTLALWSVTSQQPSASSSLFSTSAPAALIVGIPLYTIGIFTEWWCEIQRRAFKLDPANKGKPYTGGLFSLARNINYGGYTLWRTGYSLICGGWVWGAVVATWLAGDFCARAIPSMDAYCEKRYGRVQWEGVRRKVPYVLLPGIY